MNRDEIQKTGCRDLYCLLRRMSGVTFSDISELEVLKDAGEYGVKGANGAIVIKTSK